MHSFDNNQQTLHATACESLQAYAKTQGFAIISEWGKGQGATQVDAAA